MTRFLVLVLAQPAGVFENPEPFRVLEVKAGLTLQGRSVRGSKLSEYRVITDTPYPASALCERITNGAPRAPIIRA